MRWRRTVSWTWKTLAWLFELKETAPSFLLHCFLPCSSKQEHGRRSWSHMSSHMLGDGRNRIRKESVQTRIRGRQVRASSLGAVDSMRAPESSRKKRQNASAIHAQLLKTMPKSQHVCCTCLTSCGSARHHELLSERDLETRAGRPMMPGNRRASTVPSEEPNGPRECEGSETAREDGPVRECFGYSLGTLQPPLLWRS